MYLKTKSILSTYRKKPVRATAFFCLSSTKFIKNFHTRIAELRHGSAELRQILFVSYFFCQNIVSLFANLDHSIGARILFVYSHYRIATTRRRCLNLAKTNPVTAVLSTQKLFCLWSGL